MGSVITKWLKNWKRTCKIADNTLGLAHQCKTDNNTLMVSEAVPQNYSLLSICEFEYAIKVNKVLRNHVVRKILDSDNEILNPRKILSTSNSWLKTV